MSNKPRTMLLKIIIVGECKSGKTLFSRKITKTDLVKGYIPTIALDMYILRKELFNDLEVKVHLWDTSGSPGYYNIIKSYFCACCASIIVIDLSKSDVISNVVKWIKELQNIKRNDNQTMLISVFADISKGVFSKNIHTEIERICNHENIKFYIVDLVKNEEILEEAFNSFIQLINSYFIRNGSVVHGINYYINEDSYTLPLLEDNRDMSNKSNKSNKSKQIQNCCSII